MTLKRILTVAAVTALSMGVANAHAEDINPNLEKLKELQAQMAAQGIDIGMPMAEEAPADSYAGADAEKVKAMAREAWEARHPDDEILDTRIQMDDWDRYTDKRWSDGDEDWYMVDYSELQVLVIVKDNDKKATMWPVNVTKDHTNNDKLEVDVTGVKETPLMSQGVWIKDL